jgi:GT2 family glycosyltransferase
MGSTPIVRRLGSRSLPGQVEHFKHRVGMAGDGVVIRRSQNSLVMAARLQHQFLPNFERNGDPGRNSPAGTVPARVNSKGALNFGFSHSFMPSVAITIPTLRGDETLESCLRALSGQTYTDFQVVIVNNGGRDLAAGGGPFAFPIRVISLAANVGFGAAINIAIRTTDAPGACYVATLNDDTEPDAGWLAALVREMESDPAIGMCASNIRLFGDQRLDSAGMAICFDGSSRQRGHREPATGFALSEDVLLPSACAALYRRKMLDDIGLFDEDFFLYCEDTDLGLRARWAGWRCRYVAGAAVRHRYSHTTGAFSPLKARFVERNRLWVAIKNFPMAMLMGAPMVSLLRYSWQFAGIPNDRGAAAAFMRSGQSLGTAGAIVARAHWETLLHLPALLRKRAALRRKRRLLPAEFTRLMRRHRITAKDLAHA